MRSVSGLTNSGREARDPTKPKGRGAMPCASIWKAPVAMTSPLPADPTTNPREGDPPADPTPEPAAKVDPPKPADPRLDDPLGDSGKRALAAEREARKAEVEARKAAEKAAGDLKTQLDALAPLQKLAVALGGGDAGKGKTELEQLAERLAANEKALIEQQEATATERMARWRIEVAAEKGLTKAQAARLAGSTYEQLSTDADELLALFPAATASKNPPADPPADPPKPPTPKPDPSQGPRGDTPTRSTSLSDAVRKAMASPR